MVESIAVTCLAASIDTGTYQLQYVFDLARPGYNGCLEHMHCVFVLLIFLHVQIYIIGWHRQQCLSIHMPHRDKGLRQEAMKVVCQLFGYDFGPAVLIARVGEQREVHLPRHRHQLTYRFGAELVHAHLLVDILPCPARVKSSLVVACKVSSHSNNTKRRRCVCVCVHACVRAMQAVATTRNNSRFSFRCTGLGCIMRRAYLECNALIFFVFRKRQKLLAHLSGWR